MLEIKTKDNRVRFGVIVSLAAVAVMVAVFLFFNVTGAQSDVEVINEQIEEKKSKIEELQDKVKRLQQSVEARRSEASSLVNQMAILNAQVDQIEAELEINQNKKEETELEMARTRAEMAQAGDDVDELKNKLGAFIRERYRMDQKSVVEILLTNDSISEFFNQVEASELIQDNLQTSVAGLKKLRLELKKKEATLGEQKIALEALSEALDNKRERLASQSAVRANLLSETKNSEARFQDQLRKAKAEQVSINVEIQSLEQVIRERLANEGPDSLNKLGSGSFIYPVPFKGITTYFHDPGYPYRYIFEHPALDLRAGQGTPIRATSSGFVARVRDPRNVGRGYAYVMLIHADGISSVYGHISKVLVQEDQFVTQGEVIALTGGMPGTNGAGRLTTGPHLHFEIRKEGIPVNPLNYLP